VTPPWSPFFCCLILKYLSYGLLLFFFTSSLFDNSLFFPSPLYFFSRPVPPICPLPAAFLSFFLTSFVPVALVLTSQLAPIRWVCHNGQLLQQDFSVFFFFFLFLFFLAQVFLFHLVNFLAGAVGFSHRRPPLSLFFVPIQFCRTVFAQI